MENRHFFFKYRESNIGYTELKSRFYDAINVPLPIYFGKWMTEDYYNNTSKYDECKKNFHKKLQVDLFFGIREKQEDDYYFWIFLTDEVHVIKLQKPLNIINWQKGDKNDYYIYEKDESIPKFYLGILEKEFDKMNLPEAFSNINSNQKYNRKTIIEFEGKQKRIANHLISNFGKMQISTKERLSYLSPVQFETLIFLIFVQNKIYCSTHRGGTKEKYDLLIENRKEVFPEFKEGNINIQIKMKKEFEPPKSDIYAVYIYLGETIIEKNLFGIEWIFSKIQRLEYVQNWLNRSLDFFEIIDEED